MANEVELKLVVTPQGMETLRAHWLPGQARAPVEVRQLANTYFDTPALDLQGRKVALRLREQDGRLIQTLKTKGVSVGGLHQRGEWEWEVEEPRLYPELLAGTAFPAEVSADALVPVFRTDFQRTTTLLQREEASIELALDEGVVGVNGRSVPLMEVELELKAGAPAALYRLAREIAQVVPVWLSDISKAERGYRLLRPMAGKAPKPLPLAEPGGAQLARQWLLRLYRDWLLAMERFRAEPEFAALLQVENCRFALAVLVRDLGEAVAGGPQLAQWVARLEQERQFLQELLGSFAEQGGPAMLTRFEASPTAGLLALELGDYFSRQP